MPQETDAETIFEKVCFLLICLHAWLNFLRSPVFGSLQRCSRLTTHRSHRGFLACQFVREFAQTYPWESLHSNNSKKSPVRSNLKDGRRVEACITEVLAQKRKPQDTNLFSVPVRRISPLFPLSFFHMRWSARKYFFNYLQMFIFFLTTPRANSVPGLLLPFFFFFGQRASIEQSPNKSTAFSSKVVQQCFTKARRQWGSHLPSEAKWPAWGHTVGHSRAHLPCDSSALSHQETLLNLYIKQAQTG